MRVVLFRHGPAGKRDPDQWPDDSLRPLTARGIGRTRQAARGLARLEAKFSRIMTSPLKRAAETAELLAETCDGDVPIESLDALAPGRSFRAVLERLGQQAADETVALVGHEPDLGKLAGVLLLGAPAALPLKKAGACLISFEGRVVPGEGRLEWFLPPGALRRHVRHSKKTKV
jgi:phosphohistidine phosphatase